MNEIQEKILTQIINHTGVYPITIKNIKNQLGCSNAFVAKNIKVLEKEKRVDKKEVVWIKGRIAFYKLSKNTWPEFIGKKCKDCHNKSTIDTCIFYEELADAGYIEEPRRVMKKLDHDTIACQWFIDRKTNWERKKFQDFLDETRKVTKTETGYKTSYHCKFCGEELPIGNGFIAKLGSSVIRCINCESIIKLVFKEKENLFRVIYAEEKGDVYREHFYKSSGIFSTIVPYVGTKHGIVIPDLKSCTLNFNTKTLIVCNWVGKLTTLEYIVARKKSDYDYLLDVLPSKGYKKIHVIFGGEKIKSPPPIKQQVGILNILRETKIANKEFCLATLVSRRTILQRISHHLDKEKLKSTLTLIETKIQELNRKTSITPSEWNDLDRDAAKNMWWTLAAFFKKIGIYFPGRGSARLMQDNFKPYGLHFSYSAIDTLINGVYDKARDYVKEYCTKINFCWDGLPGICHGKTKGGVFGLHLDMSEPVKLVVVPFLIEALVNEEIIPNQVQYKYGRRRQKVFFVYPQSELDEQLEKIVKEALNSKMNGKIGRRKINDYYLEGKYWLNDLIMKSNNYEIKHHGVTFQPWAIIREGVWGLLDRKEKDQFVKELRNYHNEIGFKPLALKEV